MGYNSSAKPSCLFTFLGILTFGLFLGEAVIQFYFSRVLDIIDEDVEKEKLLFNMQPADVALAGAIIHALLAICFGLWAWLLEDCLKHNSDCQRGSCAVVLFSIVIVLIHAASTFATNIYSIATGSEDTYGYVALGLGIAALFTEVVYGCLKMDGYSCGCDIIV
eukprot:m.270733 g.270733  ORF g.270733 m.270733 type:complete len:164 (+) comp40544_c0_seq1:1846-2337(+)